MILGLDLTTSVNGIVNLLVSVVTLIAVIIGRKHIIEIRSQVNGRTSRLEKALTDHGIAVPSADDDPDAPAVLVNPHAPDSAELRPIARALDPTIRNGI